jgi:nucleoid DNA-binding protein
MRETNISKRDLWRYVNIKVNKAIHYYHVSAIIGILFDELIQDLKDDKIISIHNFCKLKLQKTNPRKYHDVTLNRVMISAGAKILKFTLASKIKKKICMELDIDKTFKDD